MNGPTPTPTDGLDVMAVAARTNGQLMADCARLGYLDGTVADVTYGLGKFWTHVRPDGLLAFDLDPRRGVAVADFRSLPLGDDSVDVVVFDPPYKLNGTSTGRGPSAADERYGVVGYLPSAKTHDLIDDGLTEAMRVARRRVLVKVQDSISSGRLHMQTHDVISRARELGGSIDDVLHVVGYRAQPPGRRQLHARRNHSTLIVIGGAS